MLCRCSHGIPFLYGCRRQTPLRYLLHRLGMMTLFWLGERRFCWWLEGVVVTWKEEGLSDAWFMVVAVDSDNIQRSARIGGAITTVKFLKALQVARLHPTVPTYLDTLCAFSERTQTPVCTKFIKPIGVRTNWIWMYKFNWYTILWTCITFLRR